MNDLDKKRKQLIFRSWHRGTKEMDLLLGSFADKYVPSFSDAQVDQYAHILTYNDPDLYNWITGKEPPDDDMPQDMFKLLENHRYTA